MKKYGLIGYPLGHSFSGKYFREKFEKESIRHCLYSNYEIPFIKELSTVLADPELRGLNVTIPYKESVIAFLNEKHSVVEETGACNCIRISNGLLTGFNTDVIGFEESLSEKLLPTDRRALILGTGGSSKAVAWVLKKKGIHFTFVSRTPSRHAQIAYTDLGRAAFDAVNLVINTTPAGMSPNTGDCPPIPYEHIQADQYFFDLIYNPVKTEFLSRAERAGARIKNGADMMAIQAEASWAIWNEGSDR